MCTLHISVLGRALLQNNGKTDLDQQSELADIEKEGGHNSTIQERIHEDLVGHKNRTDLFVPRLNTFPGIKSGTNDTEDCIQPAITKFPRPFIGKQARRYGGVIIHICVAMYMFVGLAIICDDYFVPALDRISEGNIF